MSEIKTLMSNTHKSGGFFVNFFMFLFITTMTTISCGTDALEVSGTWQFEGLEGIKINKIIPSPSNNSLALATTNGVYIYKNGDFSIADLQDEEVVDLVFLENNQILAGIRTPTMDGWDSSLFKTNDGGNSWLLHMGNYGGEERKYTAVNALAVHPNNSQQLFARGWWNVSRSMDGGNTWKSLYSDWEWFGVNASLLKIDHENPNIIWAGGANAILQPYIIRSTDGGNTWENLLFKLQIFEYSFESTAYTIAIRPGQSSHLMLGLDAGIFRSTDLGESWESVFSETAVFTLTNGLRSAQTVYASGINLQRTLFVTATQNFGDSWHIIEMPNSPSNIHVNHMLVVEQNGIEVLFLGTNRGLYSFQVEE